MNQKNTSENLLRSSFHVIHSGAGMFRMSYVYDIYPNMLAYLKWLDEMYDCYAGSAYDEKEYEANTREERVALRNQIALITNGGIDKGMKAPCPCLSDADENSSYIEVAAYWKEFVPEALEAILHALQGELEIYGFEYEEEDEDSGTPTLSSLRDRIKEISALRERKDIMTRRFSDKFSQLIEGCLNDYLQHY